MKPRFIILKIISLLLVTIIVGACGNSAETGQVELTLASESALPDFVRDAPPQVREAYRFAIANPDALSKFPCYCGCGAMGHQNNLQCYIKEFRGDGSIEFENHAFGWSICTDITRDVMRLMREGKDSQEIRAYIDAEYSKYGPPTNTEPIEGESQAGCSEQATEVCEDNLVSESDSIDTTILPPMTVPETTDD